MKMHQLMRRLPVFTLALGSLVVASGAQAHSISGMERVAPTLSSPPAKSAPYVDYQRGKRFGPAVLSMTDRGPVVELAVDCLAGAFGIVAYSKIDRMFCDPKFKCGREFAPVYRRTCGSPNL